MVISIPSISHTAAAFRCAAEVDYHRNYPIMSNSEAETEFAAAAARAVSGECELAEPTMGGEDFAFMLNARPGAYILVGNGDHLDVIEVVVDDIETVSVVTAAGPTDDRGTVSLGSHLHGSDAARIHPTHRRTDSQRTTRSHELAS